MRKGFTMIELLLVIAILGVLAVVILIALNPVQQLARTRDAGRISAVNQLGHALEAYAVANNGVYVPENTTWITTLVNSGEITTVPSAISYSITGQNPCSLNIQPNPDGFCYDATAANGTGPAIVYASMESMAQDNRCPTANPNAWAVYSTANGRGGIVCTAGTAPAPGTQSFLP